MDREEFLGTCNNEDGSRLRFWEHESDVHIANNMFLELLRKWSLKKECITEDQVGNNTPCFPRGLLENTQNMMKTEGIGRRIGKT